MRSGPDRRCASYCTWSSRSRTTVLESADDQWRTPVTRGNLDNSCAEAGELAGSPASEIASEASFASVAGGAGAVAVGGATDASFAIAPAGVTGIFSVWIIALLSCAVFRSESLGARCGGRRRSCSWRSNGCVFRNRAGRRDGHLLRVDHRAAELRRLQLPPDATGERCGNHNAYQQNQSNRPAFFGLRFPRGDFELRSNCGRHGGCELGSFFDYLLFRNGWRRNGGDFRFDRLLIQLFINAGDNRNGNRGCDVRNRRRFDGGGRLRQMQSRLQLGRRDLCRLGEAIFILRF